MFYNQQSAILVPLQNKKSLAIAHNVSIKQVHIDSLWLNLSHALGDWSDTVALKKGQLRMGAKRKKQREGEEREKRKRKEKSGSVPVAR